MGSEMGFADLKNRRTEDELKEQVNSPILRQSDALVKVSLLKVKRGNLMISSFPCFLPAYYLFFFSPPASHPDDLT